MDQALFDQMWESEKSTVAFAVDMWKQRDAALAKLTEIALSSTTDADVLKAMAKQHVTRLYLKA